MMDTKLAKKGGSHPTLTYVSIIVSLVILINPNLNLIDIFPDFIAYFILAGVVKKYTTLAPYFEEVRSALIKLAMISLIKIPMMVIMLANMSSGSDIVPLMTLIFVVVESIFLFPLIRDIFNALFYLGERGANTVTLAPFKLLGLNVRPEGARLLTYIIFIARAVLNVAPSFCLLTYTEAETVVFVRGLYAPLEVSMMAVSLILGLLFIILAISYMNSIRRGGGIEETILEIAGDKKLARLDYERGVNRKLFALTLFFVGAIFLLDMTISVSDPRLTTGTALGINLVPRFIFPIIVMMVVSRLTDKKWERISTYIFAAAYAIAAIGSTALSISFNLNYAYDQILSLDAAKLHYLIIEIVEVVAFILFLLMMVVVSIIFLRFARENTGTVTPDPIVSRQSVEYQRQVMVKSLILTLMPVLIAGLKLINAFLVGKPTYIYTDPTDPNSTMILTQTLPVFGLVILIVTVAYIFYAFYYTQDLKGEIKLKYSNDEVVFE